MALLFHCSKCTFICISVVILPQALSLHNSAPSEVIDSLVVIDCSFLSDQETDPWTDRRLKNHVAWSGQQPESCPRGRSGDLKPVRVQNKLPENSKGAVDPLLSFTEWRECLPYWFFPIIDQLCLVNLLFGIAVSCFEALLISFTGRSALNNPQRINGIVMLCQKLSQLI